VLIVTRGINNMTTQTALSTIILSYIYVTASSTLEPPLSLG